MKAFDLHTADETDKPQSIDATVRIDSEASPLLQEVVQMHESAVAVKKLVHEQTGREEAPRSKKRSAAQIDEQFLINITPQETRVALMREGVVQEIHIERAAGINVTGNIYLGRVERVLPGLQSAFVNVGLERNAFLHFNDLVGRSQRSDIEPLLSPGQSILVQTIKEPLGLKGARLTAGVSLVGRQLVYLPLERDAFGVPQKIYSAGERQAFKERLRALRPPGEMGGFILRTNAEGADDEALRADMDYLRRIWQDINKARHVTPPALLYRELNLAQRVLRDMSSRNTNRILVDSRESFYSLCAFSKEFMPQLLPLLALYTGNLPLFESMRVEEEIQKALKRELSLKSGGTLVFDENEAMTTIDVNTGRSVRGENLEKLAFKTNMEAAQAIGRQLRLRNLGGIILVDFIDMHQESHREQVLKELVHSMRDDAAPLTVAQFSRLGLVEISRKRIRDSLSHQLCESCPNCAGRGHVKTARTLCYEILREVLRESHQFAAQEYRILASAQVVSLFQEEEAQALALLSEFIDRPISLKAVEDFHQEQYDIVLM